MSSSTSTTTSQIPQVTAPPGKGLVVIPGQTPGAPSITQPSSQPAVPGPANDPADFYGLGAALALIVVAIFVVRKIVPLGRQFSVGRHPAQPPGSPASSSAAGMSSGSFAPGSVSPGSSPEGSSSTDAPPRGSSSTDAPPQRAPLREPPRREGPPQDRPLQEASPIPTPGSATGQTAPPSDSGFPPA